MFSVMLRSTLAAVESASSISTAHSPATSPSIEIESAADNLRPLLSTHPITCGEVIPTGASDSLDPPPDSSTEADAMAATFAGVGFGNAGVHLPHGMSYAVSGLVKEYAPDDYPAGKAIVPHGMAVILNAPAVFRYTASTNPERHMRAAQLLGADIAGAGPEDAGDLIAERLIFILREIGVPNGLGGVGYTLDDVPALVEGTLPQHRVTKLAPRPTGAEELTVLFTDSMQLW